MDVDKYGKAALINILYNTGDMDEIHMTDGGAAALQTAHIAGKCKIYVVKSRCGDTYTIDIAQVVRIRRKEVTI